MRGLIKAQESWKRVKGVTCNSIARWDGRQWQPLGTARGGFYPSADALTVFNSALIVGGAFTIAVGQVWACFARWGIPDDCGACCLLGGICELRTETGCLTADGERRGAGTACEPNPCVTPGGLNGDGGVHCADISPFVKLLGRQE